MSRRKIGDNFLAKPLWVAAGVALLGIADGLAVLTAACGSEEDPVRQQESATPLVSVSLPVPSLTPGPGVTLWRWVNVTVLIPDGSDITVGPQPIYLDPQGTESRQGLSFGKTDPEHPEINSQVRVDAENGTVVSQDIREQHRAVMEMVLATLAVSALDRSTTPWPYNGEPPQNGTREVWGGMSYVRPDPATGIIVETAIGSYARGGESTPGECEILADGKAVAIRNGRSSAGIGLDATTHAPCKTLSHVLAEDLAAFERYFSDVKRCNEEIQC